VVKLLLLMPCCVNNNAYFGLKEVLIYKMIYEPLLEASTS
jgi:hypothetical protein